MGPATRLAGSSCHFCVELSPRFNDPCIPRILSPKRADAAGTGGTPPVPPPTCCFGGAPWRRALTQRACRQRSCPAIFRRSHCDACAPSPWTDPRLLHHRLSGSVPLRMGRSSTVLAQVIADCGEPLCSADPPELAGGGAVVVARTSCVPAGGWFPRTQFALRGATPTTERVCAA